MFAGLNLFRVGAMKKMNLKEFEFSQNHTMFWDKLEKAGVRPERLQLEWISAAEGQKFAKVMRDLEEMRKKVTREEVEETVRLLNAEEEEKQKKKLAKEAKLAASGATA